MCFLSGGECQPGFYCPEGSHEPIPCPGGYYCAGKRNFIYTTQCDPGYYCTSGSSTPRPLGVVGNRCPAGKFCPKGTKDPFPCPAGSYSNATGLIFLSFKCLLILKLLYICDN